MQKAKGAKLGDMNAANQQLIHKIGILGFDRLQWVYLLECQECGYRYGSKDSEIRVRKCPRCQLGAPGLKIE